MELKKIRVLHITNNLGIGGVQKIIYELCSVTQKEFEYISVASCGGVYVDKFTRIGIEHYQIPDLSTKKINEIIKIVHVLKKIIYEKKINIIHCHHRMAVFYAKMLGTNLKIVYNNHTIYSDKRWFSHELLKNVNIIADGEKAKRNVTKFFKINRSKIVTINNAVDEFNGSEEEILAITQKRNEGKFIVMNAARFHPQKGIIYFVDAAKILIDKGLNIAFFIVGDGPLRLDIEEHIKKTKLADDIILLGFQSNIKSAIRQSDVLVLTSIYEGLPLTPMEAFSVKRPVIATDIDGTKEVIKDKKNGLLVESMNPVSIAEGIETLYNNRSLLKVYGDEAYRTYLKEYNIEIFTRKYLDFYLQL